MAIDIIPLWDYAKPDLSEQRFKALIASSKGDDVLILQTQVARSYGLRKQFDEARKILQNVQPLIQTSGDEVKVRYWLEWGRSYASAAHPATAQTEEAKSTARNAYQQAFDIAQSAKLDYLAIDALHMMAFVDPAPEKQLEWNRKAIDLLEASSQADAKRWATSLYNNTGYALHEAGRYEEAHVHFEKAFASSIALGDTGKQRIARWMIAWNLRALKREDEALAMQLELEKACDAAGEPDEYVYEELAILYASKGDDALAETYRQKHAALKAKH